MSKERTYKTHTQDDLGHGRIETRICSVYKDLGHIGNKGEWAGLKTIARIRTRTTNKTTGKTSNEQRIYISSLAADAKNLKVQ